MRLLNIFAALGGALALAMLAIAHHALSADPEISFVFMAAGAQLAASAAGLAVANRSGTLNLVAGALVVGGAALFAGIIYLGAFHIDAPHALAPIGGGAMMLGWVALAFARPAS